MVQVTPTLLALFPLALAMPQGWRSSGRTRGSIVSATSVSDAEITVEPFSSSSSAAGNDDEFQTSSESQAASLTSVDASSATTASGTEPTGSSGNSNGTWWKPTKSDTIVVDLENKPIPSSEASVYVADLAHTAEQIQAYHDAGKKVVCYFSAGAWDPYRDDKTQFLPECYCGTGDVSADAEGQCTSTDNKQENWDAYWFDLMTPICVDNVKEVLGKRILDAASKGCDGIDPDNVDSSNNNVIYGNDDAAQLSFNLWLAKTAHDNGLAIDLKNAGYLTQVSDDYKSQLVDAFDFNVIESCHQYGECGVYDPFLDADKPQIQLEYADRVSLSACDPPKEGVGMLYYQTQLVDSSQIDLTCYA